MDDEGDADRAFAAKLIRLGSHAFETAAEGLEATDMLCTLALTPSQVDVIQLTSSELPSGSAQNEQTTAVEEVSSSASGAKLQSAGHCVPTSDSQSSTKYQSSMGPHIATAEENAGADASDFVNEHSQNKLDLVSSQYFGNVAEGIDAADAADPASLTEGAESGISWAKTPKPSDSIGTTSATKEAGQTSLRSSLHHRDSSSTDGGDQERWPLQWPGLLNQFQQFSRNTDRKGMLISRDRAFHQTSNQINIKCIVDPGDNETRLGYFLILASDYFDVLLNYGTAYIVAILVIVYTLALIVFAGIYYAISLRCATSAPMSYSQSFALSLETAATVGYTLPQDNSAMFFDGCAAWVIIIYMECIFYLIFNGVVIGTLMLRYSRADRRSNQIIFSECACILCIRGRFYFTFQCFDLQASQPIIGATVRTYAIVHDVDKEARALWQVRAMRLIRPDDELGARLWLSVPCVCIHEIDAWSPLAPALISKPPPLVHSTAPNRFPQPPQRSADGRAGSRSQTTCAVCGSCFMTEAALRRHIQFSQVDERLRNRPETSGHLRLNPRNFSRPVVLRSKQDSGATDEDKVDNDGWTERLRQQVPYPIVSPEEVRDAIKDRVVSRNMEVVCILEGTDPHTGRTFQARHSYSAKHIRYDAQHAPCMGVGSDGAAEVNLSFFHDVTTYEDGVNIEEPFAFPSHV